MSHSLTSSKAKKNIKEMPLNPGNKFSKLNNGYDIDSLSNNSNSNSETETDNNIKNTSESYTIIDSDSNFNVRLRNWITIFVIGLILESIFREKFYEVGIVLIRKLQSLINDNIYLISFFQILSFLAAKYFLIVMLILAYNYHDTYSSLLLMIISSSAGTTIGFFKLVYKHPRPYFHEDWIKVYDCETGFGNPSGHSITAVSVYLSLYKILFSKVKLSRRYRKLVRHSFVLFIFCITISRLALGAHSLNQIIFGSFIGAMIYALFFDVFKIDLNLTDEIYVIMKPRIFNIFSSVIAIILLIGVVIFNFIPTLNDLDSKTWGRRISENCPNTPYSKLFDFEAYFMLSGCSALIGAYLGIYIDIKYNMQGNVKQWVDQNIGNRKWNKTSFVKSIIRLIFCIIVVLPTYSLNFFICGANNSVNVIFFLKNLLPHFTVNFVLYGFTRRILFYFNIGVNKNSQELNDIK